MSKTRRKKSTSKNHRDCCSNKSSFDSNGNKNDSKLCCFSYIDYIVLSSALAIGLAEELSDEDLAILSTFFAVLSDELALITTVNGCESDNTEFVSPLPDLAVTSSSSKKRNNAKTKKIYKKKK